MVDVGHQGGVISRMVSCCSAILNVGQDAEDLEEEVEDIEVQTNARECPLVWVHVLEEDMRVENDPRREQQATKAGHRKVERRREREEDGHHRRDEECQQNCREVRRPRHDIPLGLEGEEGQAEERERRDKEGLEKRIGIVRREDEANRDSFEEREGAEQQDVSWRATVLDVYADHARNGADRCQQGKSRVLESPGSDLVCRHDPANDRCGENLEEQDAVHLAHEVVPYILAGLTQVDADFEVVFEVTCLVPGIARSGSLARLEEGFPRVTVNCRAVCVRRGWLLG